MKNLIFIAQWNVNRVASWSGTHLSLFNALSKRYDVMDIDSSYNKIDGMDAFVYRVERVIRRFNHSTDQAEISRFKLINRRFNKRLEKGKEPVFQFEASPKLDHPSYLYIDLHADYVHRMKEDSTELFQNSNFAAMSDRYINALTDWQKSYFESCAGVFSMGKWVVDEINKRNLLPASKLHHVGGG